MREEKTLNSKDLWKSKSESLKLGDDRAPCRDRDGVC